MEQPVIKINGKDTIDQIVELTDKVEGLNDEYRDYQATMRELKQDETANAKAIQQTAAAMEKNRRETAQTVAARQHLRKEVDNAMKLEKDHSDAINKANIALNMQVHSIAQAQEANRLLRDAVRQVTDEEDASGEMRRKMNAMINQNTQYIKDQSDELVRQKMTVGDYKEQV